MEQWRAPMDRIPHELLASLGLPGSATARRIGAGHIHATWLVDHTGPPVVLQRLNTSVFPRPEWIVENAETIGRHLAARRAAGAYPLEVPRQVADLEGNLLLRDAGGAAWRALEHVGGTVTFTVVDGAGRARDAAAGFGRFAHALEDLDPARLHVVIPHFHDLGRRLDALDLAVSADLLGRAGAAAPEIDACRDGRDLAAEAQAVECELPPRVCHHDTKIDNILFDASSGAARAVIDLDTAMPGRRMYDYGDMVRSFCSPEPEDSTRLDRVRVREDIFEALTAGFLEGLAEPPGPVERRSLWTGARAMCLMVAARFLTDHLEGDRYFATSRPGQNLDRARAQLALHRDLVHRRDELTRYLG